MITTDQILTYTTTYDILEFYTRDYRGGRALRPMVVFQNPLISRTQKTPSFNVSYWKGQYYYKDYATGHHGSAFDLVIEMYGLNLPEACAKINQDMNLGIEGGETIEAEKQYKPEPKVQPSRRNYRFGVKARKWESKIDDSFWGQFGVRKKVLEMFKCFPISSFYAFNKENKQYEVKARFNNPLYFYQRNGWGMVYKPYAKYTNKFYNIGRKPFGYLFGLEQLPQSGKRLFFVGGEKDVVVLRQHGYYAVCFNSESSSPDNYPDFFRLINSGRFGQYIFMYDSDEIGQTNAQENALKYNLPFMELPQMPEGYKDISDYFKLRYQKLAV